MLFARLVGFVFFCLLLHLLFQIYLFLDIFDSHVILRILIFRYTNILLPQDFKYFKVSLIYPKRKMFFVYIYMYTYTCVDVDVDVDGIIAPQVENHYLNFSLYVSACN